MEFVGSRKGKRKHIGHEKNTLKKIQKMNTKNDGMKKKMKSTGNRFQIHRENREEYTAEETGCKEQEKENRARALKVIQND